MSKERSSQNTMKRRRPARRCARQAGSEAMSSRWISTSLRSRLALALAEPELAAHLGVRGLHQRRLAHAARAPQQGVVGGQALGEAARVVEQLLGGAVDALEQAERLAVDVRPPPGRPPARPATRRPRRCRNPSWAAAAAPAGRARRQGARGAREWPSRRSLFGRSPLEIGGSPRRVRSIDERAGPRHRRPARSWLQTGARPLYSGPDHIIRPSRAVGAGVAARAGCFRLQLRGTRSMLISPAYAQGTWRRQRFPASSSCRSC